MKRRDLVLAGMVAASAPAPLRAQVAARSSPRVALVFTTSRPAEMAGELPSHPSARAFVQRMRALGYVANANYILEPRSAEGRLEALPAIFADLVRTRADVIVAVGHPDAIPAIRATRGVPVILVPSYFDPVGAGLVESLAHPGRNVTGLSITPTPEIEAKRLEMLKTILPNSGRVAFLGMEGDWNDAYGSSVQAAARQLGLELTPAIHQPNDYAAAFGAISRARPDSILVANTPVNFANRQRIVEFTTAVGLPAMFSRREYVESGGLASYGVDITSLFRRAAEFVDRILRGASPADLPVEQPTKFELVLNLRAAKALGIDLPATIMARADELID